ncbi:hypothetical protein DFH09DRAFT_1250860 [Mycena vulgaris]|nr:hypothetical protein DFH09DRAFT_1250860 [Mycena vulgaris]
MVKRGGRGHAEDGVEGTKPGELAMLCPCCPRPGRNIPDGWENVSPEDSDLRGRVDKGHRFLYIRRLVANGIKDLSLGPGWSYLLESLPYRSFLLTVTDQDEMSTCSGLAALDYVNTKFSRGYSATGVGMGVCARHEFVQPNGVGDLQKGERLLNIISYNIVCQWWKNLVKRLKTLPPLVRLTAALHLMHFVIPKMHIHAHTPARTVKGLSGRGHSLGGIATSMREMGPGSREDTLSCHWGWWNWQKLLGLAATLRRRADRANAEYVVQLEGFTEFSVQQSERVPAWRAMVEAFKQDPKQKNLYELPVRALTEGQVLLQFTQEEADNVAKGVPSIHQVSSSSFVVAALEVEDQQHRVRVQVALRKVGMTAQQIDLIELRTKLTKSICQLWTLQATYTPASIVALSARKGPVDEQVEDTPLFLPSALMGWDSMRDAQCAAALMRLRNQLHIKSRLLTYKKIHSRHQGPNT